MDNYDKLQDIYYELIESDLTPEMLYVFSKLLESEEYIDFDKDNCIKLIKKIIKDRDNSDGVITIDESIDNNIFGGDDLWD